MTRRADVRETYDRIAAHFAETRPKPWPEVETFLEGRSGAVGLDIGTGNGRHAELLAERTDRVLAADVSVSALRVALDRAEDRAFPLEVLQADAATLPLRTGSVDLAIYIATIHHLPSRTLRRQSLSELARVLTDEGTAILSAWSVSHDRFEMTTGFDTTVDWTLPGGEVVPRYYHIYDLQELGRDVKASELELQDLFEAAGNCYAVVGAAGT